MVAIPDQLIWEVTKKTSSFIRKKNGHSKRSGSISFSVEPGNVKSLNKLQYSGLANSETVDVVCSKDNRAQLVTKSGRKSGTKVSIIRTNLKNDFRRATKNVLGQTSKVYYRRDLEAAALGKYTKVYQANRRAKGITKPVTVKKGRTTLDLDA